MQLVGKVLWWNERDGFGVIEDIDGNEYYFDSSSTAVRSKKNNQVIKRNLLVTFEQNVSVKDCACACRVKVASATERRRIEEKMDRRQLRLPDLS